MPSATGQKAKGTVKPLIILAFALIVLYSFGFYTVFTLIAPILPTINSIILIALPWLAPYWFAIFAFILLVVLLGIVLAYVVLRLMKRAAAGVLRVVWLLEAVFMIGLGIFLFIFMGPLGIFALIFPLIGIIQLWVWFRRRQKIERAGKLVEFTATLLLEEKEMFIVPLVTAIFSMITFFLMFATFYWMYGTLPSLGVTYDSWLYFGFEILVIAGYLFGYFAVFYLFEGVNVSIAHTWFRKEDPVLRGALSEVRGVAGTIIKFAALRTLIAAIQSAARRGGRRQGGIFAIIGAILSRIIGAIFRFLTYFTLPAIIIEGRGLKDSIKRSANVTWRYLVDVYIAETGVSTVFSLFGALLTLGYFATGFVFGYIFAIIVFTDYSFALIVGIIFAILFMIFAAIPSYFIFRPLNTAYRTFMFAYALDEESGFKLPSRLPKAYADTIEEAQAEWEAKHVDRGVEEPPSEW